ncbi:hypothetical protein OXX79_002760 [Metschnikowia pulcherrima]
MRPAHILSRAKTRKPRETVLEPFKRSPAPQKKGQLPKNVLEAAQKALARRPYYDPANSSLDFTKGNKQLLREIQGSFKTRSRLRISGPANNWSSIHGNIGQVNAIKKEAQSAITSARISAISSLRPLAVGDVVLLRNRGMLLYLVVAAPNSLRSDVYTFVNHEGEVIFGTKHSISLRIPGVLASCRTEFMNLVAIEEKVPGIAPVGVPDTAFSRQKEAVKGNASKSIKTHSKNAKTPEKMLSPSEPAPASLDAGPREFTVAQASAQLLTDTSVNTYIVPTSAREIYSPYFTKISLEAFRQTTTYGEKLDFFHRVLQYDDSGSLISAARTIPIFELYEIVEKHELPPGGKEQGVHEDTYRQMRNEIRKSKQTSNALGLPLPTETSRHFATANYSASSYIAFIGAISRASRKWKLNVQRSTKTPISVDILPLDKATALEDTIFYLKNGGIEETAAHIVSKIQQCAGEPSPQYTAVIQMLKDFVAGNITNDCTMESLSGSIVRSVDDKLRAAGIAESAESQFTHEFSRSRAYEILMALENTGDRNPLRWNSALALPETGTSRDSDRFSHFYNYLDKKFSEPGKLTDMLQNPSDAEIEDPVLAKFVEDDFYESDPMAAVREDFGDTPVYCIDSETAHEIDDGISIEDGGTNFAITVHIANPTSYLKPSSSLSQIAFSKGTTVYLPEGPTMMLPGIVSKLCGLNGQGQTRTLGIRFLIGKNHVQGHLEALKANPDAKPSDGLAKAFKQAIEHTATVKFYNVSNFPKNFTYKRVNEVLNDPTNVARFLNGDLTEGSHEHNLFQLHMIADFVRHFRVLNDGADIGSDSSKVSVDYITDEIAETHAFSEFENGWQIALPKGNKSDTPVIKVTREVNQNSASKSQHLVSNLMIAANYAGSVFAQKQGFPIIFRHSELNVKTSVWKEIRRLSKLGYFDNKELSPEERSQLLSVVSSANFSTFQLEHHLIGLKLYSNFTSPLRRYVDMVNHWKVQDFIFMQEREKFGLASPEDKGEPQLSRERNIARLEGSNFEPGLKKKLLKESQKKTQADLQPENETSKQVKSRVRNEFGIRTSDMDYIASHLQGCDLKNRDAQRFSDRFWMAKFLKRYFELQQQGQIRNPIKFRFLLGSDAKHGDVRAELIGFSSLRTTIVQNPYIMGKFASEQWSIGQVLEAPRFRVLKLDFIEGEFTIELVSPKDTSSDTF